VCDKRSSKLVDLVDWMDLVDWVDEGGQNAAPPVEVSHRRHRVIASEAWQSRGRHCERSAAIQAAAVIASEAKQSSETFIVSISGLLRPRSQ
jgi:hypothetical protein